MAHHSPQPDKLYSCSQLHSSHHLAQPQHQPPLPLDLSTLTHQIHNFEVFSHNNTRLRYESQVFVLKKRRNNLFRGFQKKDRTFDNSSKSERYLYSTSQRLPKPSNKNAIKFQKFFQHFLARNYKECRSVGLLEFLADKHKLSLQIPNKTGTNLTTYSQALFRRVNKYRILAKHIPPLGNSFDFQSKSTEPEEGPERPNPKRHALQDQVDCFAERPNETDYIIGERNLQILFMSNKNEIMKASRIIHRLKSQKQCMLRKLAYQCVKEVERRYNRSLRTQNDYINRAKKLHREGLLYWRKREKELIELRKKKEKLESELKKRDDEEQEAQKQQKRLQYIMYQSGLYSHFMATKLGVEGEPKKEIDKLQQVDADIDVEAAQLNVDQIINSKKETLEKFDKKKRDEERLDLSSVDQGHIELVGTPSSFQGVLKEYQIKGFRWLNNLFEQGINGILADQMGLGKTIQAIALLAHISQRKGVWGPFLVVAPNSTLFNWQQEFKKFCPALRVLPYWGTIKQRKTLRKFFSSKKFTERADSPFHVVVTSYQLTVSDDKAFKRLKWQFMILDEAQAIKNILSQRWNTLKEFQSRNRLLLTGTPIQNNMAQLWALLNFVMPDLFDSHELFNEWFSKDIEAHSQDQKELDQIKIRRLREILKPFMLRRVKKDVEHEIGKKYQHQILCQMTKRQKILYDSIKDKLNVKELFRMFESKAKVENLMNLVMQLRKVCNHPQLFERRPARSPFLFQHIYYYTGYMPIKSGSTKLIPFNSENPIDFALPRLLFDSLLRPTIINIAAHKRLLNIYAPVHQATSPAFSAMTLMNLTYSQIEMCFHQDLLLTGILLAHWSSRSSSNNSLSTKQTLRIRQGADSRFQLNFEQPILQLYNVYIPNATAPTPWPNISSISYVNYREQLSNNKFQKFIMEGKYQGHWGRQYPDLKNWKGILEKVESLTLIKTVDFGSLIGDSSKLKELDRILKQKKQRNDKVLIFCQMTKMIDILEDFMNLRKYTFFRLDGACNIADRRDMVNDFQKPSSKVFVFLLSTRAGGLGVTLTAANTVIFYDNDWNPTMDAQATDRAHRIGQSRDVNVYQLITKGTIEERIVKRAQQKKTVQSTVYQGASFNFFKKDLIIELMVDEFQDGEEKKKDGIRRKAGKPQKPKEQKTQKEEGREGRETAETKDNMTAKESKELKEIKENKQAKQYRETNDLKAKNLGERRKRDSEGRIEMEAE